MVFKIEDARGLVGALKELAKIDELVPLVAGEGRSRKSLEEVGLFLDLLVKFMGSCLPDLAGVTRLKEKIALVERLEHL